MKLVWWTSDYPVERGASASVGHYGHAALWLNGLVYVDGNTETTSFVINCYNPVNNLWSSSIQTPYSFFAMARLCNNLFIGGGIDKSR